VFEAARECFITWVGPYQSFVLLPFAIVTLCVKFNNNNNNNNKHRKIMILKID